MIMRLRIVLKAFLVPQKLVQGYSGSFFLFRLNFEDFVRLNQIPVVVAPVLQYPGHLAPPASAFERGKPSETTVIFYDDRHLIYNLVPKISLFTLEYGRHNIIIKFSVVSWTRMDQHSYTVLCLIDGSFDILD